MYALGVSSTTPGDQVIELAVLDGNAIAFALKFARVPFDVFSSVDRQDLWHKISLPTQPVRSQHALPFGSFREQSFRKSVLAVPRLTKKISVLFRFFPVQS